MAKELVIDLLLADLVASAGRSGRPERDPLELRFRPVEGLPGGAYDELITAGIDAILRQPSVQAETD